MKTAIAPAGRSARERGDRLPAELVLGRYRLSDRLGSGGFGTVWRAHDERLDREVAVKRIPRAAVQSDGGGIDDRRRAAREALAAARLNHRGIVALHEAGADDDAYYIVSELVLGSSLGALYEGDEIADADVVRIGAELAAALAHAHARGIVHRDVKPQNVIVSDEGAAKLADFGVARIAGSAPLTHTGDVVGTLAYMAPEQSEGREAGPPADLYSLALVVYEGLAGFNPVRRDTPAATARAIGRPLPALRRSRRDLPEALCTALDRALDPDPQRRGALEELRSALLDSVDELDEDAPRARARLRPARRAVAPLQLGRHERALAAAGAALLAAGALAWLGPSPMVSPLWGLAVGVVVGVLPRAGWITAAVAGVCWLAIAGQPGAALLVAAALAVVPMLLPRAPALWSLPALAPALGAIGLAPAYPAVAGQVSGAWRRAAVAATGAWWLLLAEPLLHRRLLLGVAAGTRDRASWQASVPDTVGHALVPLLRSGALGLALVWAALAIALPWVVRGRSVSFDLFPAAALTVAGAAATVELTSVLRSYPVSFDVLWLVPGGFAAIAVATAARGVRRRDL